MVYTNGGMVGVPKVGKFMDTASRIDVHQGLGGGGRGNYCSMGTEFAMMKSSESDSCTTL